MGCCGNHEIRTRRIEPNAASIAKSESPREDFVIMPYMPCAFCAEKHVSDAWDMSRECGYATPNRQTIIGALGSAERHLFVNWRPLAEKVRAARHLVQLRREGEIDWKPLLAEIDALATAEARKIHFDDKRK